MIPSVTGLQDPREGEWPEETEWCFEHGQRKDSCGSCADLDCTPLTAEEIEMELQRVVLAKLADDAQRGTK